MSDASVNEAFPIKFPSQREVLYALFKGKFVIAISVVAALAWQVSEYRSDVGGFETQMQVVAAQRTGSESTGAVPNGGLASLTQLALPSTQTGSEFRFYLDSLHTRDIADELAKDSDLMHTIFSSEWDPVKMVWVEPQLTGTDALIMNIKDFLGFPAKRWHPPDGETMLQFLDGGVLVTQDPRRNYVAVIKFSSYDPQ